MVGTQLLGTDGARTSLGKGAGVLVAQECRRDGL